MFELVHYLTEEGEDPFQQWLERLDDRQVQARISVRLGRFESGNFGDVKPVGEGVHEARFHMGPGYRVYFAHSGRKVILLLAGGNKASQVKDVESARRRWQDWRRRRGENA